MNNNNENTSTNLEDNIGDLFQQLTKYSSSNLRGGSLKWTKKPSQFKQYKNAHKIQLPAPKIDKNIDFHYLIKNRKSIRKFSNDAITLDEISYLTWISTGIQRIEYGFPFRTAPSAGALYPIETYLIGNNIENLERGIYHYNIPEHALELIEKGDFRRRIADAALGQEFCAKAAVVFCHTAIFMRSKWKYGQRAYRYIYLDAGHIAQNLGLAITALNLGGCHVGALFDDDINDLLKIDGKEESILYLTAVGRVKKD
ncbi:MAG: SagB/ThcOx family dehydrogenase [Promethearchaeota archaeon]